jgi:hypothetical protein
MEESQVQQPAVETTTPPEAVKVLEPAPQTNFEPVNQSVQKGQWILAQVVSFLSQLSENLGRLFGENQRLLINLGLILGAIIAFRVSLAVIAAINEIPLVAPTFELVGIAYSVWFISRYMLGSTNRQELAQKIQGFLDK